MLMIEKQTIELTLRKDELIYIIKDLLLVPFRWVRQTMGSELILNLPEEFKDDVQNEIFEFLRIRLRKEVK